MGFSFIIDDIPYCRVWNDYLCVNIDLILILLLSLTIRPNYRSSVST